MDLTRSWLRDNTRFYLNSARTYADIDALFSRFHNLRPKTDVYTYDDGRTQLLLCIHGLLSISYRQASYNIPIAIWLPRDYPKDAPIAYVVATTDMLIRSSKFIEVSGRCHIDYLQNWLKKSEGCNILSLLESMQCHFSKDPPVYAKPKDPLSNYSERPPPPLPPNDTSQAGTSSDKPPLPPKPNASPQPPIPIDHSRPAPTPPIEHTSQFRPPFVMPPSQSPPSFTTNTSYQLNQQWSSPPTHQIYPQAPISPPPSHVLHPQHPPVTVQVSPPPPPPLPPLVHSSPPRNLLDEDGNSSTPPPPPAAAPPRPPNPELLYIHSQIRGKLISELTSLTQAIALDAERLRAHQSDLLTGEPAIRDEMARLEAVKDVCHSVSARLRDVVDQAERNVAELRQKGDPEVDELVCSTTIVHNQLVDLIAEDNAIEDTIYHLHRALNGGRIDLERFLRTTRMLAEEQFMKRALIEKIQVGVPMGRWT